VPGLIPGPAQGETPGFPVCDKHGGHVLVLHDPFHHPDQMVAFHVPQGGVQIDGELFGEDTQLRVQGIVEARFFVVDVHETESGQQRGVDADKCQEHGAADGARQGEAAGDHGIWFPYKGHDSRAGCCYTKNF